ncbi:protein kinase domain-containing protein [Geodermatophilus sp. SYSU D00079]
MESTATPVAPAERDGRPQWNPEEGGPVVPGYLAWDLLAVGHRRETWLCWSVDLWAPAVVKVVRPGWKPRHAIALDREVRALSAVRHPALPRLLHDGREAPVPFIAVEYLDGDSLYESLTDDGPMQPEDVACLGVLLLGAVRALHACGLAHMDVDPYNVMLVDRRPRLVDLGSSRPLASVLAPDEHVGTDGYRGPELAAALGGPVTPAMDVYGVGATLRKMLDPEARDADGVVAVIDRLTDDDPGRRPPVEVAMTELVRYSGDDEDERPWPDWADGLLGSGRPAERPTALAAG